MMTQEPITDRQREVAQLVAEGRSNPEIADALGISLAGAKYHVSELLGRLGVQRREDIAAWYRDHRTDRRDEVTPSAGRTRRVRALWLLGILAGATLVAAAIAVALAGGRATEAVQPTPTAAAAVPPEPAPTSAAATAVAVGGAGDRTPLYSEYEPQPGDTPQTVAQRFGISVEYIYWNNPTVPADPDYVRWATPGTVIRIPGVEGILHSVRVNETVVEIAERYDADWRDIIAYQANDLSDPNAMVPGTLILVPGGVKKPLAAVTPPRPAPQAATSTEGGWQWPVVGTLKSPFSPEHPLGIDIAAPEGTSIVAASAGTVTFVGGNACCDLGLHVIIEHSAGYETLYAHFKMGSFAVTQGQWVNAGDYLGTIGMTGRTDEPHLHFELRRHGVYQDPGWYLP